MSASVLLASWFKETKRGMVIGTPCFGSSQGTHGNPATIFLKYSGLPISISTLKLTPKKRQSEICGDIQMDKTIRFTKKDLRTGKDPFEKELSTD